MEKILPKIDITEDFVIGSNADINNSILSLYTQYPCRLKAEIFVLCMGGNSGSHNQLIRLYHPGK